MSYTSKKECRIIHKCSGCRKKQIFINTRRFLVNANGNKIDIWIIYQCRKCKHTLNIPIFERIAPNRIPDELYEKFLVNDEELAVKYGMDNSFFKSRHLQVEK